MGPMSYPQLCFQEHRAPTGFSFGGSQSQARWRGVPMRGVPMRGVPTWGVPMRGVPTRAVPMRGVPMWVYLLFAQPVTR